MPCPSNLTFWNVGSAHADAAFGGSTHGFATFDEWVAPEAGRQAAWNSPVPGTVLGGTYTGVLDDLARAPAAKTGIVLFARADGMEAFLTAVGRLQPGLTLLGGATARQGSTGELAPPAPEVSLLLLPAGEVETTNVLTPTGPRIEAKTAGPRRLAALRAWGESAWQPARQALVALKARSGCPVDRFEEATLADPLGRNLHLSVNGDELDSGAQVDSVELVFRTARPDEVQTRFQEFCSVPNALVVGCAGLRSLLARPLRPAAGTLVVFLFGEVIPLAGQNRFGNLMLGRLRFQGHPE